MDTRHAKDREQVAQCEFCSKMISKHRWRSHMKIMHNDRYKCEFCKEVCEGESGLNNHIGEIHMVPEPTNCQFCPEEFDMQYDLLTHVVDSHTPEKFNCVYCERFLNTT